MKWHLHVTANSFWNGVCWIHISVWGSPRRFIFPWGKYWPSEPPSIFTFWVNKSVLTLIKVNSLHRSSGLRLCCLSPKAVTWFCFNKSLFAGVYNTSCWHALRGRVAGCLPTGHWCRNAEVELSKCSLENSWSYVHTSLLAGRGFLGQPTQLAIKYRLDWFLTESIKLDDPFTEGWRLSVWKKGIHAPQSYVCRHWRLIWTCCHQ